MSLAVRCDRLSGLRPQRLLSAFRGEPAVDRDALATVLVGLGRLGADRPDVASVDVNPSEDPDRSSAMFWMLPVAKRTLVTIESI